MKQQAAQNKHLEILAQRRSFDEFQQQMQSLKQKIQQ